MDIPLLTLCQSALVVFECSHSGIRSRCTQGCGIESTVHRAGSPRGGRPPSAGGAAAANESSPDSLFSLDSGSPRAGGSPMAGGRGLGIGAASFIPHR